MNVPFKLCRSFCYFAVVLTAGVIFCGAAVSRAGEVRFVPDVPYLAPGRTEKLDLYLPVPDPQGRLSPGVVWIHGHNGDKGEKRAHIICGMLAAAGYVCVSINHGPDAAKEANIRDCKNAVRFLRVHAVEYHLDPEHIAAAGGSAGGYHALIVGFTAGDLHLEPSKPYPGVSSAVCAVVDFYGPMGSRRGLRVPDCIAPGGPPVLILQGQADRTVSPENSFELDRALKANGIPHEFLLLPGVDHSFRLTTTWDDKPLPIDLGPVVLAFLNRHLRPETTGPAAVQPHKASS
jgi:acetyl esterase/lipase